MTDIQLRIAIQNVSKICCPIGYYDKGKFYYGVVTDFGVVGEAKNKKKQWRSAYNTLDQLGKIKTK